VGVGILLAIFYVLDRINFQRPAGGEKESTPETWKFDGLPNLFFVAIVLGAVFVSKPIFMREAIMLAAALGSYFTTKKSVHEANHFNFHPLQEVAILFAGIFATMMPALDWLNTNAREVLGTNPAPGIFFWSAGGLSSVLDNAPTYLGFLSALFGMAGAKNISELLAHNSSHILAISIGAVFFGAATYIGNGPNFMVKAIADNKKIPIPTFLGFIFKYTFPFLLPVLIVVWWLFFNR
jgi:Na+/H+ antiporter NhaD/arsenite permease-like protein